MAPATVGSYVAQVRPFLVAHEGNGGDWMSLTARQVAVFVTGRAVRLRPRSLGVGVNALRALLRWMWLEAMIAAPLADTIGSIAAPTGIGLPQALTTGQVSDLLAALGADGAVRRRDEAMLALMWRLGLCAGEVASLRLEDIDWRGGVVVVRGKGDRLEQVPLPVDVGELIVTYLQRGRPVGRAHRQVFLALRAPYRPLGAGAVSSVVARALARAGISGPGAAHRLRHTAACRVLAGGGGLVEAGQLLRHTSAAATAVYAKSDLAALAVLARPWPVGASR
ncbi:MAG: tyrosine-type recombinase/integrase [Stenotrophomonas sp.]|uniref:tyrosine-type recombinase/integrase n=1 Tax=Stenotrophomonas sp. TaxID=69392 RepID=UPI003D6D74B7